MSNASTLTGPIQGAAADLLSNSSTQLHAIGTYCETADGRGFRYAKIGAVSTVPGKVYAAAAWDSTNQAPVGGLAVAAQSIGDTSVTLTGSLTLAANLLQNGYMATDVTPGQGYLYKVAGNTAVTAAANCVVTLADPLQIALTTSSKVVFVKHPYDSVIVSPGGASTGQPVGVATSTIITNANFGWLQTFGACAVLSGVATSISLPGVPVTVSASTAGSVIVSTAILPTIGWAMQLFTATEYNLIYLTIH
jgi:hypothetical protein